MILRLIVFMAAVVAAGIDAAPAMGQAPFRLRYSAPKTVTLHEPVRLDVEVTNQSDASIEVDLGWNYTENFVLDLTLPTGASERVKLGPQGVGGIGAAGLISLPAGEIYTQTVLLNEWLEFARVGPYRLTITFSGGARTSAGRSIEIERSATMDIIVGARDARVLEELCTELLRSVRTAESVRSQQEAARMLAHIKDPVAVPYLVRVAESGRSPEIAIPGLARIGSPDARRALEQLSLSGNEDIAALARAALRSLRK